MENKKLQELTSKLYEEGLSKGREEAAQMRQRQGIRSGSLRLMLNNWKQRGYIVAEEDARCLPDPGRQRFRKTEKYLGRG